MAKAKSKTRYNFGYGAIYQRKTKNGKIRWYLDYRDGNGERIQKVAHLAATKEEAAIALKDEISKSFDTEYGTQRKKSSISFREFSQIYLESYARVAKKSWMTDEYRMKALDEFFSDTRLESFTPLLIQKFRAYRLEAGNQKSTTNRYLTLLKKMFQVAIEEGYVSVKPVKKVNFYSEKENLKERILTREEEVDLLKQSAPHLKSILTVALHTGMRKGELLSLQWKNVSRERKTIRIERSKSGKTRIIPVNATASHELSVLKARDGDSPFVFLNPETGKPFRDVTQAFKGACKRAKIKGLRFHDLRHTFATRLIERGQDIVTVQNLLGHSSIQVTQRYTHSNDERKIEAVKSLEEKMPDTPKKEDILLHSCDTEKDNRTLNRGFPLYSVN